MPDSAREAVRQERDAPRETEERTRAYLWAEEGIRKYGNGATAWLRRWIVNYSIEPRDDREIRILEQAIRIVEEQPK